MPRMLYSIVLKRFSMKKSRIVFPKRSDFCQSDWQIGVAGKLQVVKELRCSVPLWDSEELDYNVDSH